MRRCRFSVYCPWRHNHFTRETGRVACHPPPCGWQAGHSGQIVWKTLWIWEKICWFDSDRKPCLYPITWPCLSPITWSTELRSYNGTYLLFRRLQYMLIQYRVSNWTIFWLHNDRKSFLTSFLPVTSSWMRTYTSCDDVTRWRQAAFAYAVNRSNALQTEKHLIKMGFRQDK